MPLRITSHIKYPPKERVAKVIPKPEPVRLEYIAKPWTEADNKFMRTYYKARGSRFVAEHLGRTMKSVQDRARTMGLVTIRKDRLKHLVVPV